MFPRTMARLKGSLEPPGDKSVGHRLALIAALAHGPTKVHRFPPGQDCRSTLRVLEALGVAIDYDPAKASVRLEGAAGSFRSPEDDLDAGNSGTTARLVAGILAAQPFDSRLVGDESLSRRPFERVITPLTRMGARLETPNGRLPLSILGGRELRGIDYRLPVPSAQVKSAVLLAGLLAKGRTRVVETSASRDHTERALRSFGARIEVEGDSVEVEGGGRLTGGEHRVPGDFSSASFFIGAAAFLPGSDLVVENVGLNPTRTGFLEALRAMGARIEVETDASHAGEPQGRLRVRAADLAGTTVTADRVPSLIDELPILAVVASFAEGETRLQGLSELRVKESDRLSAVAEGLDALGVAVEVQGDDLVVEGRERELRPAHLPTHGDHRMVMAWAIASLAVEGTCEIDHLDQVRISYPGFWDSLHRLIA